MSHLPHIVVAQLLSHYIDKISKIDDNDEGVK